MSTPSGASVPFKQQVTQALQAAGATIVVRCATCGDWHAGDCPFANGGASTPFVAVIGDRDETIDDGVGYEGRERPEFLRRDDAGWRVL